jgi:hypothetical protein
MIYFFLEFGAMVIALGLWAFMGFSDEYIVILLAVLFLFLIVTMKLDKLLNR